MSVLYEVLNFCHFREEEKPDVTRLKVALVNQERVLLVSLWGEHNSKSKDKPNGKVGALSLEAKWAKLKNVITFVEKVRVRLKVDGVLVGGSFNLRPEYVRERLDIKRLHGQVFASDGLDLTAYVVVWPEGMFSCEEVRELTEEDYGTGISSTSGTKKPTVKETFARPVLYYKIDFLRLDKGMDRCLSEVDCRSVIAVTQAVVENFGQSLIKKTRTDLFQYAKEMLRPVGKLMLRDTPSHSFARDVVELYRFVARHTTCFPWMVLSAGSRKHHLQQQLAKTTTEIKQGNPTEADGDGGDVNFEFAKATDREIFGRLERAIKATVSTLHFKSNL